LQGLAEPNVNTMRLSAFVQKTLQVRAVQSDVRCPIAILCPRAQSQNTQHLAGPSVPRLQAFRKSRHLVQRIGQPPRLQNPRHIGPQLDTGPNLAQLRGTFPQLSRQALARAGQSSSEAADAPACNQHLFEPMVRHTSIVPRADWALILRRTAKEKPRSVCTGGAFWLLTQTG